MKKRKREPGELRRRAEERLAERKPRPRLSGAENSRLVHELDVHQLELEMQNEELHRSRLETEVVAKRFTDLFDFAPIGYFAVTADGIIREANFAGARLLGLERSLVVGRLFGSFVSRRDIVSFTALLKALESRGGDESTSEERELEILPGRSGSVVIRLTASSLAGPVRSFLLAAEDITARKRAEEALRMEARRKDDFLAALSHELRNPLAPIRNSLFLLERASPGGEQARSSLEVIDRQVAHLTRIIDDLLDVTRISRGKVRIDREPLDLHELVRSTVEDHRAGFDAGGIALESRLDPAPCWVSGDATRLAQVLGNLLGNAAKFTGRKGRVAVTLRNEGSVAVLSVRDTGVGIATELRERLFEPFAQAPQTLDRAGGGLGLGLAMVKGLVELHGGMVGIESEGPGRGTEVRVRLPLAAEPAKVSPAEKPRHPRRHHHVLVIEDNEDAAESLKDVLELGGHDVRIALDGPAGIALAREFRPGIVICDIGLPGMDGYEVARALRADEAVKGAYLIALSGYARPEDLKRAIDAGFDRHVAKPPTLERLETLFEETPRPPRNSLAPETGR